MNILIVSQKFFFVEVCVLNLISAQWLGFSNLNAPYFGLKGAKGYILICVRNIFSQPLGLKNTSV